LIDLFDRRFFLGAVGLVQGIALYALIKESPHYLSLWFPDNSVILRLYFFALLLTVLAPKMFILGYRPEIRGRLALFALCIAVILALAVVALTFRFELRLSDLHLRYAAGALIASQPLGIALASVLALVSLPFFHAGIHGQHWWKDYPVLFREAWSLPLVLLVAWLYVAVLFGVLFLCGQLLDLIGIEFLKKLLKKAWFSIPFAGLGFGVAAAIVQEQSRVVSTLRGLVLSLSDLLIPVLCCVSFLFLFSLPFTGLEALWGTRLTSPILLTVATLTVLLLSGFVREDDSHASDNPVLSYPARLSVFAAAGLIWISAYSLWLRVDQHGWSPDRLIATLAILILFGYVVSGAVSVAFGRGVWRARLRRSNTIVSMAAIGLALLTFTPFLDIYRISSESQVRRLQRADVSVEKFDFAVLKWRWGVAGTEALKLIQQIERHPQQAQLDETLRVLAMTDNRANWQRMRRNDRKQRHKETFAERFARDVTVLPKGYDVDPGVLKRIALRIGAQKICEDKDDCAIIFGDYEPAHDGDEAVLVTLRERWHRWGYIGKPFDTEGKQTNINLRHFHAGKEEIEKIREAILSGELKLRPPVWMVLDIGGVSIPPSPY